MTLDEFKNSKNGSKLAPLLGDAALVSRMESMTRLGHPAVRAIDEDVARAVGSLDNVEKQHVGRWVRDILGRHGLKPVRQLDWRGGKIFSSGSVYAPIAPPPATGQDARTPSNALDHARSVLAAARVDPAQPIDTVDRFLAERRTIWGDA